MEASAECLPALALTGLKILGSTNTAHSCMIKAADTEKFSVVAVSASHFRPSDRDLLSPHDR